MVTLVASIQFHPPHRNTRRTFTVITWLETIQCSITSGTRRLTPDFTKDNTAAVGISLVRRVYDACHYEVQLYKYSVVWGGSIEVALVVHEAAHAETEEPDFACDQPICNMRFPKHWNVRATLYLQSRDINGHIGAGKEDH